MKKIEKEFEQINTFVNRQWERTIGLANYQSLLTGWVVGSFVSSRLKSSAWGSGTVDALVDYLKTRNPKLRGYGRRNIYNMVLFYDTYSSVEFKGVYRRLKLGEFVQTASAQLPSTFSVAAVAGAARCDEEVLGRVLRFSQARRAEEEQEAIMIASPLQPN